MDDPQRLLDEQEIMLDHLRPILNIADLLHLALAISKKVDEQAAGFLSSIPSILS